MKDCTQFVDLDVFDSIMADKLIQDQKKAALHALNLMKLKRDNVLK